VNTQTKYLL